MKQLTKKDIEDIKAYGLKPETVEKQLQQFKTGFPFCNLQAPATPGNGIMQFTAEMLEKLIESYATLAVNEKIVKFVPASGAATRMFKKLFEFIETFSGKPEDFEAFLSDQSCQSMYYLFDHLDQFSFYEALVDVLEENGLELSELIAAKDYVTIGRYILGTPGLGYGNLPKGLLLFHTYAEEKRTAFEEHIVEAFQYCRTKHGVKVHFTVSPEHLELFGKLGKKLGKKYFRMTGISPEISFSIQKPSTDTLAVNPDNTPFRDKNGELVFRPAGHGALIDNLQELNGTLIFIKNIDNVVPDRLKEETYRYKKVCGALLLQSRNRVFKYLDQLDKAAVSDEALEEMHQFANNELYITDNEDFNQLERIEKIDYLYTLFNRPIRVCGMVKNEGEPGGGPFWVKDSSNRIALQIVESAQINIKDTNQKAIFESATHFNPVDLVCSTVDFKGNPFHLTQFIDEETGFISAKSKDGKPLRALELPGLWNGAMADWITLFVEVPLITFNPVKEINDLLREQHRSNI
ncbi:MAG: DUF4301 family protein [Bacteroidales bacterium]|nr:DUF4301 family protein [Bacteroidales bacterium]MDD3009828.1 DUF4301 family protein [Bacteroidales bacterium]MDY0285218.1 DUF4301 family protein [Bacteroidales bacterium]